MCACVCPSHVSATFTPRSDICIFIRTQASQSASQAVFHPVVGRERNKKNVAKLISIFSTAEQRWLAGLDPTGQCTSTPTAPWEGWLLAARIETRGIDSDGSVLRRTLFSQIYFAAAAVPSFSLPFSVWDLRMSE